MGYGMRFQRSTGIHLRQRSRAFVLVDRATDKRLVYVVADIGMFFRNVREAILARLDKTLYDADNVVLTATHTHAGVGGYSCYRLYNMTTDGFRPYTFNAIVEGVVESIRHAEADLAPGRLLLARGQLHDASVNPSPQSFARPPDADRRASPAPVDPTSTRNGRRTADRTARATPSSARGSPPGPRRVRARRSVTRASMPTVRSTPPVVRSTGCDRGSATRSDRKRC